MGLCVIERLRTARRFSSDFSFLYFYIFSSFPSSKGTNMFFLASCEDRSNLLSKIGEKPIQSSLIKHLLQTLEQHHFLFDKNNNTQRFLQHRILKLRLQAHELFQEFRLIIPQSVEESKIYCTVQRGRATFQLINRNNEKRHRKNNRCEISAKLCERGGDFQDDSSSSSSSSTSSSIYDITHCP